jgi:RNA polymerase sigma factor (sigma-70 family)
VHAVRGEGAPAAAGRPDDDVDTVDALFRARWAPSVRLAAILLGDVAVAEEVVQDAFVQLSRRWAGVDNPAGYLRTAVVNGCRNHHRRLGTIRRRTPAPLALTVEAPELDELWAVLARLPERRRAALVLRYYEDLPVTEIARLLDCKPATVSSLLHRGLADLRKVVAPDAHDA